MKKTFLAITIGAMFFVGCKEIPPPINFNAANYVDSAYVGAAPSTTVSHNVLVEEWTGEGCSNCPGAKATLDAYAATVPGRVNIISLYQIGGGLLVPPSGASYNFTDSAALEIASSPIYNGVPNLPNAGIDRVAFSGSTLVGAPNWTDAISSRLAVADSMNMTLASNVLGSVATITVTVTYAQTVTSAQNISLVIVQDSVIDFQEEPLGRVDSSYMFNDVFVAMVSTVPFGDPMLTSVATKSPGQVLQRVYTYSLPAKFSSGEGTIVPAHCRVIAFVNAPAGAANYQVYQSVQAPLIAP